MPLEKQDEFAEKHNLAGKREKLFLRAAQHYYENNSDQTDIFKYIYNGDEEDLKQIRDNIKDNSAIAAAFRAKQDLMKLEDALTPDTPEKRKFNAAIIKEFEKDPSYTLVYDGPLDNKGHAEMRIVDYLRKRSRDPNNKLNENIYIGLSKLCCTSCDVAINKSNLEFRIKGSDGKEHKVNIDPTRGGHGEGFEWSIVNTIKDDEVKLEAFLGKDAYEIYKSLKPEEANTALYSIVRHIAENKLKVNGAKVELIQKEDPTAPFHEKPKFAMQYAYNSASKPEDNLKRNNLTKKAKNPTSSLIPKAPTTAEYEELEKKLAELNAKLQIKDQEIENLQSKLTISENKRKNVDIDVNNNDTTNKKPRTSDLLDQSLDNDIGSPLLDNQSKTQTQNLKISPELSPYNSPQQDNEEMFFPGPDASTQQILDFDPIKYLQSSNKNNNANKITTSKDEEEDLGYESEVPHTKGPISPSAAQIDELSPSSSPHIPFSFDSDSNLTQAEKKHLVNLLQTELDGNNKYDLTERLAAENSNQELLNKLDREAVITANINIKAIDAQKSAEAGKVEVRGEKNHLTDHKDNTQTLIDEIQKGVIDKNTVIAIERKQYGDNLSMKDVIKLASILEHNEKNPNNPITLPKELENTPILQDAILYKTAKEHGVKVISLEGKNLEHGKASELQNENREQYMTSVISEIRSKGYNVIANVGSSHEENLKKALENQQKDNVGFNHIPRKLNQEAITNEVLQKALAIAKAIPVKMISINSREGNNILPQQSLTKTQLKRSSQIR
ncbi:hypothetical protein A1I_04250 [Rickettsia bellii OSU 85-389]|nr:hypothetical protein [Rickettsia bellii]ABV79195.1 hypothetical protein A1I_04250 [Rickettsia bellii OSU 85-389]